MHKQLGMLFGCLGGLTLATACGAPSDAVEFDELHRKVSAVCGPCPAGSVDSAGYCWVVNMGETSASATCARVGLTGSNGFVTGLQWTPAILADVSNKLGCVNLGDTGCCAQSMWYQANNNTCFTDNFSADVGGADFFNWSGQRLPGQFAVDACSCPPAPPVPQNKDDCKDGGWQTLTRADFTPFKNQGDCIQYVNTGR